MIIPKIIVGLGYGDEGKGRTVDYFCSQNPSSIVVRFSGGQQAGHTVMIGKEKHTFSNFGSGTFRRCPTYFSEHTTVYPVTMMRERKILNKKGIMNPKIIIHPLANLTTPYDVWVNRMDSENYSHGTCGLGVGKTMTRNLQSPFKLYAIDLLQPKLLLDKLEQMALNYAPYNFNYSDAFKDELKFFIEIVYGTDWQIQDYSFLKNKDLIFEGSQGVLLDMDHGIFPHVTYANTTCKNAIDICKKIDIDEIKRYGVTRTYHTRHGNGPFEEKPIELKNIEEEINVNNEWQRAFKKAPLDVNLLKHSINIDNIYANSIKNDFTLVITCLDQYEYFPFDRFDSYNFLTFNSPKN